MYISFQNLKRFDAYSKPVEELRIKTVVGAMVSVGSCVIMALLFVMELRFYLHPQLSEELLVDFSKGQKVSIFMNITLPNFSCDYLTLDAIDVTGEQQSDITHDVYKTRLDKSGNAIDQSKVFITKIGNSTESSEENCGSCYGAESYSGQCCNTCQDIWKAYRAKGWSLRITQNIKQCANESGTQSLTEPSSEGCRFHGSLKVNKVAGNIHIAPGLSFSAGSVHVHELQFLGLSSIDIAHYITHFGFGEHIPEQVSPLNGVNVTNGSSPLTASVTYYIKVVPTSYRYINGTLVYTNQYSSTMHVKHIQLQRQSGLPGIFFTYEFSPLLVQKTEFKKPFTYFVTNLCAIIGGVFTVFGLLDAGLHQIVKRFNGATKT